jgi:uncharacterized coiled-coil protein SlyX
LEHSQRQKVIIRENKALAEARGSLSAQVAEAQSELPRMTARYERAMAACDKRIRRSHILLAQIKANLESLSTDLTDVRADVSLQSVSQMRLIRTQLNRIRSQAEKEAAHQREMAEHQTARSVSHKEAEIARLEKRSIEFANSRQVLTKFFNDLALTAGIPDRCDEPSSFGAVFSEVLAAEGQAALKQHIREAGITTPVHLYIQSVREQCDRSLRAKEEELDNIIAQSRKRRRKLQDELDAALAKLRSLQGSQSFPSSDEMFDEIDHSSHDFDTSARQLDATMQRLRRALGKA